MTKLHRPYIFPKMEMTEINDVIHWRLNNPFKDGKGITSMWVNPETRKKLCDKCYSDKITHPPNEYICINCENKYDDEGLVIYLSLVNNMPPEDVEEVSERSQLLTQEECEALYPKLKDEYTFIGGMHNGKVWRFTEETTD